MPDVKFNKFRKGWFFRQPHLIGLDGFNDVNNFVIYKNAIEKVRGWDKLILIPEKFSDAIDSFSQTIDDFDFIIDDLDDSAMDPFSLVDITYPLQGPEVLSIFEYLRFQEEEIHLGDLVFNPITFFNVPRRFRYLSDFRRIPRREDNGTCDNTAYGMLWTCDITNCPGPFSEVTYDNNPCNIFAGPAIGIQAPYNKDNATLYGLIYDPVNTQLVLAVWNHQSLTSYGTILDTFNVTLSLGDRFRIADNGDNTLSAFLNDTEVIGPVNDDLGLLPNSCFGVIWISAQ